MKKSYLFTIFFLCISWIIPMQGQCPLVIDATILPQGEDPVNPGNCLFKLEANYSAGETNNSSIQITLALCDGAGNIITVLETSPMITGLFASMSYPPWESQEYSVGCDQIVCVQYSAWKGRRGRRPCAVNVDAPVNGSLPVDLIRFEAYLQGDQVKLEWLTATEENNDYFELQHSTDGITFEPLDRIEGKGTTSITQYYQYLHSYPARGNNYYRLKQVDIDGEYAIFEVVQVEIGQAAKVMVFPSSTTDLITLELPEATTKDMHLLVVNSTGEIVKRALLPEGNYKMRMHTAGLPAGLYFIRFLNDNNEYEARPFVKIE